jgi:hypothetical protein
MSSAGKISVFVFYIIISSILFSRQVSAQQPNISFQVFYDQLSPYGEWVNYPDWGYVWLPDAGSDFVPYSTQGYWILTEEGWTWMSDYDWGWAPFHYGRWDYDQYYGWFWVPGNEWGPAWVSWRMADGYYGWSPMEPGISISVSFGRMYDSHNDHWIFVHDRDMDRQDINRYAVSRTDRELIGRRSSVINSTYVDSRRHTTYVTGPSRTDYQKVTGREVHPLPVQEYNKPGQELSNGNIRIYRPEVVKNTERDKSPVPGRVTNLKDVRQPSERRVTTQPVNRNPENDNKDVRKTNTVNPQKNSDSPKTLQPGNSIPSNNNKTEKQPVNIRQQNNNPSQNTNNNVQQRSTAPVNANPSQNIKNSPQQHKVQSSDPNPSRNTINSPQQRREEPLKANPSENTRKALQQRSVQPSNSNPAQNTNNAPQQRSVKPVNTNPVQNTGRTQPSNKSEPSNSNNNKAHQDKTKPERDKN